MRDLIKNATTDLRQNAVDATNAFGGMSVEQLNWKPSEKGWSVAQCLDHLVVTHEQYLPIFEKLSSGEFGPTAWERISPLSGFFGRFLIKNLDPANMKPVKTTAKAMPSGSEIGGDIVTRYGRHQQEMIAAIEKFPADIDMSTIITSPLMGLVTYSLADTLTFVPMHCTRHFLQAKRVSEAAGFPK